MQCPKCVFHMDNHIDQAHVLVGPLSPGVVLIVKSCGTNILGNVNCITMKFSNIS